MPDIFDKLDIFDKVSQKTYPQRDLSWTLDLGQMPKDVSGLDPNLERAKWQGQIYEQGIRPTVVVGGQILGGIGGSAVTGGSLIGAVGGAGVGRVATEQALSTFEEAIGYKKPEKSVLETYKKQGKEFLQGAGEQAVSIILPEVKLPGVGKLGDISKGMRNKAIGWRAEIYKPPDSIKGRKVSLQEQKDLMQLSLDEDIRFSEEGMAKSQGIIDNYKGKVNALIQKGAEEGKYIKTEDITKELDKLWDEQLQYLDDPRILDGIKKTQDKFLASRKETIPVDVAQKMKVMRNKILDKYWEKLSGMQIEKQKAITRGLRKGLEDTFPELRGYNIKEGEMIEFKNIMNEALKDEMKRESLPSANPIKIIANNKQLKDRLSRWLYSASKAPKFLNKTYIDKYLIFQLGRATRDDERQTEQMQNNFDNTLINQGFVNVGTTKNGKPAYMKDGKYYEGD